MNEAKLIAEVTVLTEMVRVLSDKVNELKAKQEQGEPCGWQFYHGGKWHNGYDKDNHRADCVNVGYPVRDVYPSPQRTWVGLTDEEAQWLYDNCRTPSNLIDMTEAKLKDKNDPNGT